MKWVRSKKIEQQTAVRSSLDACAQCYKFQTQSDMKLRLLQGVSTATLASPDTTARRIFRGFGAAGFHQLVNITLQLGLVPIFASRWGASLYGAWLLLFTIPSFLALTDFGFGTASATEMTIRVARGQFDEAARIFQNAWAIVLALSTFLSILIICAIWTIPQRLLPAQELIQPNVFRLTSSALVLYGWTCLQAGVFFGALRAQGGFAVSTFISAFTYLFEGALAVTAVLCEGSILLVASAYVVGRACGVTCLMIWAHLRAPWMRLGFSRMTVSGMKQLLPLAMASMTVPISLSCLLQGTALAIGAAANPIEVAVFSSVRTLTRAGVQLGGLVSQPAVPEFSAAFAHSDRQKLARIYLFTIASAGLVLAPAFGILIVFGKELVEIWTHGSIHCSPEMMLLMSSSMVLNGLWTPTSNLLQAMNRQALYAYLYLALALASIPFTYNLAQHFGALGGAISFAALDLLMFLVVAALAMRFVASPSEIARLVALLYYQLFPSKLRGREWQD